MTRANKTLRTRTRPARILVATLATAAALTSISACAGKDSPEALLDKARQSLSANEPRTAEIHLKNLLQETDNAEARYLLAEIYRRGGDLPSAEKEYRRALDLGFDRKLVLPPLMDVLLATNQSQKVLDLSHDLKIDDPAARAEALAIAGQALLRMNKPDEARRTFQEALAAQADNATAQVGLARLEAATDRPAARARIDALLQKQPESVEALSLRADLDIADGRVEPARETLRGLAERTPRDPAVHAKLVSLALDANDIEGARKHHEGLAKAAPNGPVTNYLKAMIELRSGQPAAARDAVTEALRLAPEYLPAVALAAGLHLQLGELEQAERHARMLVERAPQTTQGHRLLAATYLRMNAPDRALEVARRPLDRGAKDPMLMSIAGEAALKTNDPAAAAKYFEEARKLDPKDARKLTGLAMAHMASGNRERGIDELEAAVELDSSSLQADIALVMAHLRERKFDQALKAVAGMEKKAPKSPVPASMRGGVLAAKGDTAGARKAFEEALKRDPKYFPATANLANLDLRDGKLDDARKRYEALLAADPKNAQAHIALAQLAVRRGAPRAEVLALLQKGRDANPGVALPVIATARYMLDTNTPNEAVPMLQQAVNADPENPQLLDTLATALMRSGQRAQAISTWERLLRAQPNAWAAHLRIGEAQRADKNNDAALASFRKAEQAAPDALEPKLAAAALLFDMGRKDEARKIAAELKKNERQQVAGLLLEGDLAAADRNWGPAIESYRKAFAQQKALPVGTKLIRALHAAKRGNEADTVLRDWVRAEPDNLPLRLLAGETEVTLKRWKPAYDHYAVVIAKEPRNALALNNAAWALHELKDPRAEELARRAYEAAPKSAAVLDTYGVILSAKGDPKAVQVMRDAVAAAPTAPQIRLHYAEALAKAGDKASAKVEVQTVLKAVSEGPVAEQAKALEAKL